VFSLRSYPIETNSITVETVPEYTLGDMFGTAKVAVPIDEHGNRENIGGAVVSLDQRAGVVCGLETLTPFATRTRASVAIEVTALTN